MSWKSNATGCTKEELDDRLIFLKGQLEDAIEHNKQMVNKARQRWVQHNKKFDRDEYIQSVIGIIQIQSIYHVVVGSEIYITYTGRKHKWVKGGFITPTKNDEKLTLTDYNEDKIKRVDPKKVI